MHGSQKKKTGRLFLLGVLFLPLGACAGEYPAMVRARDQTIRELETRLNATQRENEELRRRNGSLSDENSELRNRKPEVVEVAAPARDDLQDLKDQFKADGVSVRYRERGLSIGIPSSVTFAPGQAKVSDQGRDVLGRVAKVVRQRFADKTIYVEGHTDTDPIRKSKDRFRSNRHLSAERADAVATYLEKSGGIASRKIVIVGFGPWDPEDPADKAANRRVEIVIAER